jgi:hypothetical protein
MAEPGKASRLQHRYRVAVSEPAAIFSVALPAPELADLSLVDPTFSNPRTPGFTRAQPVEDQLPGFLFSFLILWYGLYFLTKYIDTTKNKNKE